MTSTARRTARPSTLELATMIARATVRTGGATLATDGTAPTDGYAVSLPGLETVQELPATGAQAFIAAQVVTYLQAHADILEAAGNYAGAWTDAGRLYLDVSTVVATLDRALELGRRHDQLAVFDLATGQEIRLESVPA